MTRVSKNYKFISQLFKITNICQPFKNFRSSFQSFKILKTISKPTYYLQNYRKSVPINARKFRTYQSILIDPRNPNLHSISSKTSPIVRNRRKKIWTKIPFGQNSSKNRFASPIMFYTLSPSKPINFMPKIIQKPLQKSIFQFGSIY